MAQWTLRYTTVEDPSNYITTTGNANGNYYYDVPYNIANSNIPNLYNVNITGINSSNMIFYSNYDLSYGYNFRTTFQSLHYLDNFSNTSIIIIMRYMFANCANLIAVSNFNTSNVTNMEFMFFNCYNLINIPNFDTSNVTDMSSMFRGCHNLINIPNFNTSNVEDMGRMFTACRNLSNLSLKNIARSLPNVSQLTSQNSNLQNIGLSQNQINYISTTRYASQLQARGWNIADNYVKPALVKSVKMKQTDGTMNLAMLGTNAEYVDMEDGTTLEDTIQDLKQYIDDNVANILGGMY